MERDFETVMIEQCAPVLAGLKPAGLFRYETRDRADLARRVAGWNAQLNPKGLQVRVLRGCIATRQYLVYVYRAAKLQTVLADAAVRGFLAREATVCRKMLRTATRCWTSSACGCAARRRRRISPTRSGYFWLSAGGCGGFIRHRGKCFTCCGCWKSYGDPAAAQQHFDQLAKCTAVYLRLFHSGTPILKLAVAA